MDLGGGRYTLHAPLGAGALGVVFDAYDRELSRQVAVKLVRGRAGSADLRRLVREATAMARINHRNVVQIFDVLRYEALDSDDAAVAVRSDGVAIVMELLDGGDLEAWLRGEHDLAARIAMFLEAGEGLASAHRHGVVHRDFKPGNVVIGTDGRIKVTDFGLAAACRVTRPDGSGSDSGPGADDSDAWGGTRLTVEGITMGTPLYMAPEQHRGDEVGPACDQYAFCLALAEVVYGRRLVHGTTVGELFAEKLSLRLPSDRVVPRTIRTALRRGLEPDPRRRFVTMDDLLGALQRRETPRRRHFLGVAFAAVALGGVGLSGGPSQAEVESPAPADVLAAPPERAVAAGDSSHGYDDRSVGDRQGRERRAVEQGLAALRRMTGTNAQRRAQAEATVTLARRTADGRLVAKALLMQAIVEARADEYDSAQRVGAEAFEAAAVAGDSVTAARAAARVFGYCDDDTDARVRWRRAAETHIARAGGDALAEQILENELYRVATNDRRYADMLIHATTSLELEASVTGPDSVRAGYWMLDIAEAHRTLGDAEQCLQWTWRAL
ncbi:MAG: serine/threonine-protein kinase, partial [Myxococcota bacterium]